MSGTTSPPTFDFTAWSARYPALAAQTTPATAQAIWDEMSLLVLGNTNWTLVRNPAKQAVLLGLLTAHVAQLNMQAAQGNTLVGRVSSASEGSVSVSTDLGPLPESAAWFAQTQYGLLFWQSTAFLSQARYVPHPAAVPGMYGIRRY